jgi:hypothetical protein
VADFENLFLGQILKEVQNSQLHENGRSSLNLGGEQVFINMKAVFSPKN